MRLKSFGCSFTYGVDLIQAPATSWPGLLAVDMGWAYECHAQGGIGNLRIAETVLNQLAKTPPSTSVFVIGWTWIDRFDYTTDQDQWHTILPAHNTITAKNYYRDLHSQYRDKLTSLMNIKLVIDQLQATNTPFLMTYMDRLLFEDDCHTSSAVVDLQNSIRPHMTLFEEMTFLEWSQKHGYAISAELHPLEQAHRAAADYVANCVFDTQSTNDPVRQALS